MVILENTFAMHGPMNIKFNSFKMQLTYIISVTSTRQFIFKSKWNTLLIATELTEMLLAATG